MADSTIKQQLAELDKKIENLESERKEINKEKKQLSAKIENLKTYFPWSGADSAVGGPPR